MNDSLCPDLASHLVFHHAESEVGPGSDCLHADCLDLDALQRRVLNEPQTISQEDGHDIDVKLANLVDEQELLVHHGSTYHRHDLVPGSRGCLLNG